MQLHSTPTGLDRQCPVCGQIFHVCSSELALGYGKHCSLACRNVARRAAMAADFARRFWSHVDRSGDCWLWMGPCNTGGYGEISYGYNKPKRRAHRVAWELTYGTIPDGISVLHRCDVPACVRPEHLFLGTQQDNVADCKAKGRTAHPTMIGVKKSPEAVEKTAQWHRGRKRPASTCEKIRAKALGRPVSREARAKLSLAGRNRVLPPEVNERILAARRAYRHSDEAKAKISAARRLAEEARRQCQAT